MRLHSIVVTEGHAETELARLQSDYKWLFDEPLASINEKFDALLKCVSAWACQERIRLQHQLAALKPSGERWRPVQLPEEFWQRVREQRDREENEKQEAGELRANVNEARAEAHLTRL